MQEKDMYSIGEVEQLCKITKKALRYYDKRGILSPDLVSDNNGYRYYSKNSMLHIPIIKYFKQSGFTLEEMKELLEGKTYDTFLSNFKTKINELKEHEKEVRMKIRSLDDWYQLIVEGENVICNNFNDVGLKFINDCDLIYMKQPFNYDYFSSIINIEFTNYVDEINNAITGPVILKFPSYEEKMRGECKETIVMQSSIISCEEDKVYCYGGHMFVSCYHIGNLENINTTYQKMIDWAKKHGYILEKESYERYVTDYWTTKNTDRFVTEVLIRVNRSVNN